MRQTPTSDLERALAHHRKGNLRLAERQYRKIKPRDPAFPRAQYYLGLIAHQRGDSARAVDVIGRVLAAAPEDAEMRTNFGNALAACNRLDEAEAELRRAVDLAPDFAGAHNNLGLLLWRCGRLAEAAACFERAAGLDARLAVAHSNWGMVLHEMGDPAGARTRLQHALNLQPGNPDALVNLGVVLKALRDWAGAEDCFRRAVAAAPDNASAWLNLSNASRALGRLDEAREQALKAIDLNPSLPEAYRALAGSGRGDGGDDTAARLEAVLARGDLTADGTRNAHFALAKLYDDAGDHARAFDHAGRANAVAPASFDIEAVAAQVDALIDLYTPALLERLAGAGSGSDLPVFVLGMPRSGTTLVEQIIASHPEAAGAGERPEMERIAADLEAGLAALDPAVLAGHGDRYAGILADVAPGARRVVDKRPFNFLHIGLIRILLPRARIIHCRRDPMDAGLSIFFTDFHRKNAFSFRLQDIGAYWRQYERLMAHWRAVLPGALLEVDYEDLVADQETVSRRIIEGCGLTWDPACLAFHETERYVDTPSDWQVRQPLYGGSVGRWRNYAELLEPLRAALAGGRP